MLDLFHQFAAKISNIVGTPWAFLLALLVIIVWAFTGSYFQFSDTWQLVINTSTTIITFLMVFLIQNTQNRDSKAIHIKLNELLTALKGARNSLVNVEDVPDQDLEKLHNEFKVLHEKYESEIVKRKGKSL